MTRNRSAANKGVFLATVSANRQIGREFYRLSLEFSGEAAEAFAKFKPGQFVEIDLCGTALPTAEAIPKNLVDKSQREILLRRPFAFCEIGAKGENTYGDILYRVVGPASLRMTTLSAGNSVSVLGPLGQGFGVPEGKRTALLVIGGMGAPPLQHLAQELTANHPAIEVIAFVGAKTVKKLPFECQLDKISQDLGFSLGEFAKYGIKSLISTDDGSAGCHGLVTDCAAQWLGRCDLAAKNMIIYSCGPEAMLAKVAEIAKDKNIDCQVSMERRMACGIGLCQSCVVECKVKGSNETVYKLCCKDGPVFDSRNIAFGV